MTDREDIYLGRVFLETEGTQMPDTTSDADEDGAVPSTHEERNLGVDEER